MLPEGNILHTVLTSFYPTLQHHNSYNRTEKYRQWNTVGSPDYGHKDARNMLRYYWLPINHYLLHLVCLTFTYLSKMHGHSNIKLNQTVHIHVMTVYRGNICIVPLSIDLGARWGWVVNKTPSVVPSGSDPGPHSTGGWLTTTACVDIYRRK